MPLSLAKVGPAAFGAIAILYGMSVVDASWRRPLLALLLAVPLVVAALPAKDALRGTLYGDHPFLRRGDVGAAVQRGAVSVRASVQAVAVQIDNYDPWAVGLRFRRTTGVAQVAGFVLGRALERINRLADLAYVIRLTPVSVPYAGGERTLPSSPNSCLERSGGRILARWRVSGTVTAISS